jgi:hypothetical protein
MIIDMIKIIVLIILGQTQQKILDSNNKKIIFLNIDLYLTPKAIAF